VSADLQHRVDLILDGGATTRGVESTVIGFDGQASVLLRPGAIATEDIERVAGGLRKRSGVQISSPGQLASHYAPRTPLRLDASNVEADEALLAFGHDVPAGAVPIRNLSERGDLKEAAANLFAMLRELDASGAQRIAVVPIPEQGLGEAINDRLRRAAAPRDAA
jgi:L-threonylcarbamoyladenylate synthase